jgi:hypothetical protein
MDIHPRVREYWKNKGYLIKPWKGNYGYTVIWDAITIDKHFYTAVARLFDVKNTQSHILYCLDNSTNNPYPTLDENTMLRLLDLEAFL